MIQNSTSEQRAVYFEALTPQQQTQILNDVTSKVIKKVAPYLIGLGAIIIFFVYKTEMNRRK
jgi:hypothetical protein